MSHRNRRNRRYERGIRILVHYHAIDRVHTGNGVHDDTEVSGMTGITLNIDVMGCLLPLAIVLVLAALFLGDYDD